jgi:multidrug efflux pump
MSRWWWTAPTAARLGLTQQLIDDTLYDAFGQRRVSTMYTSSTSITS